MRNLSVALALLGCAACSLDVAANNGQPAQIRIVNAAPATTSVTAHLNGATEAMTAALPFKGQSLGCPLIFPAIQDVVFRQGTNTLGTATGDFMAGASYTIVLVNTGTAFRALALADAANVTAGNHALRFINATATAGDVYATPPAGPGPGTSFLAVGNLAPLATTTEIPVYLQRAAADIRIRLYDVGNTTTPRADITLGAFSNGAATVVFTDPTSAADPGVFLISPCG